MLTWLSSQHLSSGQCRRHGEVTSEEVRGPWGGFHVVRMTQASDSLGDAADELFKRPRKPSPQYRVSGVL